MHVSEKKTDKTFRFFKSETISSETLTKLLLLAEDAKKEAELIRELNKIDDLPLLELCEKCIPLKNHLMRKSLDEYWKDYINKMWVASDPKDTFQYRSLPNIRPLQQLLGVIYHGKACQISDDNLSEKLKLLYASEVCGDFIASRDLMHHVAEILKQPNNEIKIETVERRAKLIAAIHFTPGHLLAADYYLQIAYYYRDRKDNEARDKAIYNIFYHLCMAQNLEPISADYINNAYYGVGIKEAFAKGWTGHTKKIIFTTWDNLIQDWIKLIPKSSSLFNNDFHLSQIRSKAQEDAEKIINPQKGSSSHLTLV